MGISRGLPRALPCAFSCCTAQSPCNDDANVNVSSTILAISFSPVFGGRAGVSVGCLSLSPRVASGLKAAGVSQNDPGSPNVQFRWSTAATCGHNSTRRFPEREKKSDILGGPGEECLGQRKKRLQINPRGSNNTPFGLYEGSN